MSNASDTLAINHDDSDGDNDNDCNNNGQSTLRHTSLQTCYLEEI